MTCAATRTSNRPHALRHIQLGAQDEFRRVLAEGVLVDIVSYTTEDRISQIALQRMAHEEQQSRYQPSEQGLGLIGLLPLRS